MGAAFVVYGGSGNIRFSIRHFRSFLFNLSKGAQP
jgi:hypothetical protein